MILSNLHSFNEIARHMLNRMVLTHNAYFFKVLKPISGALVSKMRMAAAINKLGRFVHKGTRVPVVIGGMKFKLSLVIFKVEVLPAFLTPGAEKEDRHCYMLLVEYDQFIIVSKSGTAECFDLIENKIAQLSYQELTQFKISTSTKIAKLGVASLDTAPGAMRRTSYEAEDVRAVLSTLSTGNKMVTTLGLKNAGRRSTIAAGTSRINDLGRREDLDHFCVWAAAQCNDLQKFRHTAGYLDNFAEPLDYAKNINALRIITVLFNFADLLNDLETGFAAGIELQDANGRSRPINLDLITETHDLCLDAVVDKATGNYKIQNSVDHSLELRVGKTALSVYSKKLDQIYVTYTTGEQYSLLQLINKNNLFIVSFNRADVRYAIKTLFRDASLLGRMPNFLKSFDTDPLFAGSSSEKGNCSSTSKKFDKGCLFEIIESGYAADCDYLFCDDFGDEWADYIGFKTNDFIRFYHAKYSGSQFSASAFHDVVSQALKNVGNINFNQNLSAKKLKVANNYSGTLIPRLRKGKNAAAFIKNINDTYNNPKLKREIVLVINFLSKAELQAQLSLLATGKGKRQTGQILWLLSGLFGACLEKGISVRILTKP